MSTRAPSLGRGCRAQRGGVGFLFAAKPPPLCLPHWGRGTAQRRSGALVNGVLETIFPALFHAARTLSGSLRSPPSPRGEGFVRRYCFSIYACIRFDGARKAASSFRSLPHWGRGTASAVDRVLSQTAYLKQSFPLVFHAARTLSGSLRSPPSPRGEGFVSGIPLSPSNLRPFGAPPSIGRRE